MKYIFFGFLAGIVITGYAIDWSGYKSAKTLEKEKRYDEAIAVYEKMSDNAAAEMDDQQYMQWAIAAANAKKDAKTAKRLAERIRHPDRRRYVLMSIQKPEEILEKNKEIDFMQWPEDIRSNAYAIRGNAHFKLKQYDSALKDYEKAWMIPGGNPVYKGGVARNAGWIYEQKKLQGKAEELYRKALNVSRADYAWRCESLIALSQMLITQKRPGEACTLFEPVGRLEKMQGYWGFQLNKAYAEALNADGKKINALKTLDIVLKLAPEKEKDKIRKQIDALSEELL